MISHVTPIPSVEWVPDGRIFCLYYQKFLGETESIECM